MLQQIPNSIQMGPFTIPVKTQDKPLIVIDDKRMVVGAFIAAEKTMWLFDDKTKPDMVGETFVHETIEAAVDICDLDLPHQTIKTLSSMMYQAFKSGAVSFSNN